MGSIRYNMNEKSTSAKINVLCKRYEGLKVWYFNARSLNDCKLDYCSQIHLLMLYVLAKRGSSHASMIRNIVYHIMPYSEMIDRLIQRVVE